MSADPIAATNYRAELFEGVTDPPEQPEPLQIRIMLQRTALPYWAGGYADQPFLLMRELHEVMEAEIEQQNALFINQLLSKANGSPED